MYRHRIALSILLISFITLPAGARESGLENLRETGEAFAAVAR